MDRPFKIAAISFLANAAFSIYYVVFGVTTNSWWLLTLASYYVILSVVRFIVLTVKSEKSSLSKFVGWALTILTIPLIGTVILSVVRDRGIEFHMIVMIAIAAYAFTKITIAAYNLIKSRRSKSVRVKALRNISFADGLVSIFALQRSMLVSFEGMSEVEIIIMNAVLGTAVCVTVFLLGFNLIKNKKDKAFIEVE